MDPFGLEYVQIEIKGVDKYRYNADDVTEVTIEKTIDVSMDLVDKFLFKGFDLNVSATDRNGNLGFKNQHFDGIVEKIIKFGLSFIGNSINVFIQDVKENIIEKSDRSKNTLRKGWDAIGNLGKGTIDIVSNSIENGYNQMTTLFNDGYEFAKDLYQGAKDIYKWLLEQAKKSVTSLVNDLITPNYLDFEASVISLVDEMRSSIENLIGDLNIDDLSDSIMNIEPIKSLYDIIKGVSSFLETCLSYVQWFIDMCLFSLKELTKLILKGCSSLLNIDIDSSKFDDFSFDFNDISDMVFDDHDPLQYITNIENSFNDRIENTKSLTSPDAEHYWTEKYVDCSFTSLFISFELELPVPVGIIGFVSLTIDFFFRIIYENEDGEVVRRYCDDYDTLWRYDEDEGDSLVRPISLIMGSSPVSIHLSLGPDFTWGIPWFNFGFAWGSKTGLDMRGWGEKILLWDISVWDPGNPFYFEIGLTDGVIETFQGEYALIRMSFGEVGIAITYSWIVHSDVMNSVIIYDDPSYNYY